MRILHALTRYFSIRQLFATILVLLVGLMISNLFVFQKYYIHDDELVQHDQIHRLYNCIQNLDPQLLTEQRSDVYFRDKLIEGETILSLLINGGETTFLEKNNVYIEPVSNSAQSSLIEIEEKWVLFRGEMQALIVDRYDNVNDDFEIPAASDAPKYYLRLLDLSKELPNLATVILSEKKSKLPGAIFILSFIGILSFTFMIVIFRDVIVIPLRRMAKATAQLSKGDLDEQVEVQGNTEIAQIGNEINQLAGLLQQANDFTLKIGEGKLDADYEGITDENLSENSLARSLLQMRDQMKASDEADERRRWATEGVAKFAELLRVETEEINDLAYTAISNLVKYIGAQQGALFIKKTDAENDDQVILDQAATFAYDKQKSIHKTLKPGEGLIGQCYEEGQRIYLLEIPNSYVDISAGLGTMPPKCLLMVPLIYNEEIHGIVEVAGLEEIEEFKIEFIEQVGESIAANIAAVKNNERTRDLLVKSQEITERMRLQEDEMRQNMEEMQDTYREMMHVQAETEAKEANLNALINNTEDSIITIDKAYRVMIINDIQKKRYSGTQYEGIDVGINVLDTLGAVREEWKTYYDRAFAGERMDFIIKSTVNNEESFRRYHINPVKNAEGEVIGCSVFSRDVTDMRVAEIQNRKLINDLTQKDKLFEAAFYFMEVDADKKILNINELATWELGYSQGELAGRDVNDLFISRETLMEGLATMHQGDIWKEEVVLLTKEGKRIKMKSVSTAVIDSETERIVKYILVFYK